MTEWSQQEFLAADTWAKINVLIIVMNDKAKWKNKLLGAQQLSQMRLKCLESRSGSPHNNVEQWYGMASGLFNCYESAADVRSTIERHVALETKAGLQEDICVCPSTERWKPEETLAWVDFNKRCNTPPHNQLPITWNEALEKEFSTTLWAVSQIVYHGN